MLNISLVEPSVLVPAKDFSDILSPNTFSRAIYVRDIRISKESRTLLITNIITNMLRLKGIRENMSPRTCL